MSTTSWRKNTSIINQLSEAPYNFNFLQAVRLLERSAVFGNKSKNGKYTFNNQPVALFTPPATETIRFSSNHALNFSSSEISKVSKSTNAKDKIKWDLSVNFMGLTGAQGVLPYHYSEMVLKRLKMKDKSLSDFLDMFNHRTISLFYQASNKYKLPIEYERKKLNPPATKVRDDHSQVLLSLIGLGTKNLNNRLYIRDESLFYYSGLLSQQVKTTSGLKQILRSKNTFTRKRRAERTKQLFRPFCNARQKRLVCTRENKYCSRSSNKRTTTNIFTGYKSAQSIK